MLVSYAYVHVIPLCDSIISRAGFERRWAVRGVPESRARLRPHLPKEAGEGFISGFAKHPILIAHKFTQIHTLDTDHSDFQRSRRTKLSDLSKEAVGEGFISGLHTAMYAAHALISI